MIRIKSFLLFSVLLFSLSACSEGKVVTNPTIVEIPKIKPILPAQTNLQQMHWRLLDKNDFKNLNDNQVYFVLTQDEKEKLDNNIIELRRYILQSQENINFSNVNN